MWIKDYEFIEAFLSNSINLRKISEVTADLNKLNNLWEYCNIYKYFNL